MASTSNDDQPIEEDATELKFPKEFENPNCDALLTSEVYLLLEHRRHQNEAKDDIEDIFKNRETIRAIRSIFSSSGTASSKGLHKFEVAQVCNLCPETAEEAKALIPSLENKIEDEELENILKDLHSKKSFQ